MVLRGSCLLIASLACAVVAATPAVASEAKPDFGDDDGEFSRDGECDDMRFKGPGMTNTPLLDQDIRHDATDCRVAFEQDRVTFRGEDVTAADLEDIDDVDDDPLNRIQWGDDDGSFAKDGECDDMRFTGPGMTDTRLLDSDVQHDATDCRVAFRQGRLSLRE